MAALIALTVFGAVSYYNNHANRPAQADCRLATPPSTAPVNDTTTVRIAEQGYTRVGSAAASTVTIGAVLENPGDRVAYRTRVTFDVLGPGGGSVVADEFRRFQVLEVPIILPGAKVPVGDALAVTRLAQVTDVSIKPVVTQWLPAGDGNNGLAPVTATLVPAKTTRNPAGTGVISYDARSANCTDLVSRGSSYVLRDGAGKLIGGGLSNGPQPSGCDVSENRYTNSFTTALRSIPEQADLPRTEVASLCDLGPRPAAAGSGAPIN
nr:hypothetical protein GCM10020092_075450 [Actinoplanes digitatis]